MPLNSLGNGRSLDKRDEKCSTSSLTFSSIRDIAPNGIVRGISPKRAPKRSRNATHPQPEDLPETPETEDSASELLDDEMGRELDFGEEDDLDQDDRYDSDMDDVISGGDVTPSFSSSGGSIGGADPEDRFGEEDEVFFSDEACPGTGNAVFPSFATSVQVQLRTGANAGQAPPVSFPSFHGALWVAPQANSGPQTSSASNLHQHRRFLRRRVGVQSNGGQRPCGAHALQPGALQSTSVGGQSGGPPRRLVRRIFTNSRERWRQQNVNGAFAELRRLVPTHPPDKKLSKNEILRLAIRYIKLLSAVVEFQRRESVMQSAVVQPQHPSNAMLTYTKNNRRALMPDTSRLRYNGQETGDFKVKLIVKVKPKPELKFGTCESEPQRLARTTGSNPNSPASSLSSMSGGTGSVIGGSGSSTDEGNH